MSSHRKNQNTSLQNFLIVAIVLTFCVLIALLVTFAFKQADNLFGGDTPGIVTDGTSELLTSDDPPTLNTTDGADVTDTPTEQLTTDADSVPTTDAPATKDPYEGKKIVAFTFDDGPDGAGKYTDRIIEKLKEVDGRCTFFLLGSRITEGSVPAIKRALEIGCEIGNHSDSHANFYTLSLAEQRREIADTNAKIQSMIGITPTLLRPPYGNFSRDTAAEVLKGMDMRVILWSVDTEDWKYRDAETVRDNILRDVKNGSIVLMHNIYESSVEGFCLAVDELKKQGYEFVTVSEMIAPDTDREVSVFHYARNYCR